MLGGLHYAGRYYFCRSHCKNTGLLGVGKQKEVEAMKIPVSEKYSLSVREAADYFSIGVKKMRRLAEDNLGDFAVYSGNRYIIIRSKFEEYLQRTSEI